MKSYVATLAALLLCLPAFAATPKVTASHAKKYAITMKQAEKTALAKEPGTFKSKELEHEKGRDIYSFDIQANDAKIHEVNVDANSGEIVEDTVESAAAEAHEKKQEAKMHHAKKHTAASSEKSSDQ